VEAVHEYKLMVHAPYTASAPSCLFNVTGVVAGRKNVGMEVDANFVSCKPGRAAQDVVLTGPGMLPTPHAEHMLGG
jgi:hypothetical protein